MMMQDDRRVAVKYDTAIWVQAGTGGLWCPGFSEHDTWRSPKPEKLRLVTNWPSEVSCVR